jgi:hypothetical protein
VPQRIVNCADPWTVIITYKSVPIQTKSTVIHTRGIINEAAKYCSSVPETADVRVPARNITNFYIFNRSSIRFPSTRRASVNVACNATDIFGNLRLNLNNFKRFYCLHFWICPCFFVFVPVIGHGCSVDT